MLEIQREHESVGHCTGKGLHHVAQYDEPRPGPGPDRRVIDIVTEDFTVYRFSQLRPDDPFVFEPGNGRDHRITRAGRLPCVVACVIEAETPNGWHYTS